MKYSPWNKCIRYRTDPPQNCQLTVKKLPKIFIFFKKIATGNFFEKNENFWQFFWKKCQVFGNFWTVKWQFSGGSALSPLYWCYNYFQCLYFYKSDHCFSSPALRGFTTYKSADFRSNWPFWDFVIFEKIIQFPFEWYMTLYIKTIINV